MKKEDIQILRQLVKSLEEAELKLEDAFQRKDYDEFNKAKKFILEVQRKISGEIK